MDLFGKLFSKRADPEAKRVRQLAEQAIEQAVKESKKPQGAYKMAVFGAETRQRLINLIEEVEAEIGQTAIAFLRNQEGVFVHPKLTEAIRRQDDWGFLEPSLFTAFPTADQTRRLNEEWPATVSKYRGRQNTEALLKEKSVLLATYIVYNIDIVTTIYAEINEGGPELSDDQEVHLKLEEAAFWHRIIDELAHRYLGPERPLFMAYLRDNIADILALQGVSPDAICDTMADRVNEYGQYREWFAEKGKVYAGTLFMEAAKNLAICCNADLRVWALFPSDFQERLKRALVYELLTGNPSPDKRSDAN